MSPLRLRAWKFPMRYKVRLRFSEEGVSASVPWLPGCHSQGADEAEAMENIADAIREYLEVREEILQLVDEQSPSVAFRVINIDP